MDDRVCCPGDYIRAQLDKRGWTQSDLARILNRPLPTVNRILNGKHSILPEMAVALGTAFGNGAEQWMQREAAYRLSLLGNTHRGEIRRRAELYDLAPIKEMEHRQWILPSEDIEQLETQLKRFFGVESLDGDIHLGAVTRAHHDEELTPSQRAWCYRVRQLGKAVVVGDYREDRLDKCARELRRIAAYPQEAHKIPNLLASYGIRLIVVEPLSGSKVDGVALWLDQHSPVIGLSLRYDRVDGFWFTLCHEFSHIRHRDKAPVDSALPDRMLLPTVVEPEIERRADEEAAAMLVSPDDLKSFILRVSPLYSKDRIVRFAHRIKIHPGIVVGQLQHRGEIGYHANRAMLVKMRYIVAPAATTDGWGHSIDPRTLL